MSSLFAYSLFSLVPQIKMLGRCRISPGDETRAPLVYEDHFLFGLVSICDTACLPPWLVTACHAYMHIYEVLGLLHTEGFKVLHKEAPRLEQTLTKHRQYMSSLQDWNPGNVDIRDFAFEFLLSSINSAVEQDPVQRLHEQHPEFETVKSPPAFHIQKCLPVGCGSLLFITQQGAHVTGLLDSNTGLTVLAAAHLYNAARLCGALKEEWPDMEWFISQHSGQRPFVLENLKSATPLTTAAKHYAIALGVKPSTTLTFKRYTRKSSPTPTFQYADVPPFNHSFKHGRVLGSNSCSPYMRHMTEESSKNRSYQQGGSAWNGLQELVLH